MMQISSIVSTLLLVCLSASTWASGSIAVSHIVESNNGLPTVSYELSIPNDKEKYLTIYSNGKTPVFHLQTDENEWLIDGKNGAMWGGSSEELFQNYTRIDGWNPSRSLRSSGANELIIKHLKNTGCFDFNFRCSTLVDADYVVYISSKFLTTEPNLFGSNEQEILSIKYINYSTIFQHVENVFSGDEDYNATLINQKSVRDAIAYAGRNSWRERYVDALRKLKEPKRLYRFMKNLKKYPEIMSLPFVGKDLKIESAKGVLSSVSYNYVNVSREFSIAMCTLKAKNRAKKLLTDEVLVKNEALKAFVSDCRDYPAFVKAAFIDVADGKDTLLATKLRKQSEYYSGDVKVDILAYSCWLDEKACVKKKIVKQPRPSMAKIEKKGNVVVNQVINKKPVVVVDLIKKNEDHDLAENDFTLMESKPSLSELDSVSTVDNQLALLDAGEIKVSLVPDEREINNLVFLTRPVGDTRDGKFMVKYSLNKQSKLPLSQGNYRVRVDFSIDFEREDKCAKGVSCLFEKVKIRSKKASKSLVFYIGSNNNWSDERLVNFGSLVPLVADGASRYTSTLKKVNMVVRSASFELN